MKGWRDLTSDAGTRVVCIGCGETIERSSAREYDKYGDRWDRAGKDFEYLCKSCDKTRCHHSRDGLEEMLIDAGAGETDRETFLRAFLDRCEADSSVRSEN